MTSPVQLHPFVVMVLLMEYIVVCIYIAVGFAIPVIGQLQRVRGEESADI